MTVPLLTVFDALYDHHGPQHWWPGESPFEIMAGAVLTQNTAWTNVERAIGNLIAADALDARRIVALAPRTLARYLRPAGYFNVKAERLRNLCRWYLDKGPYEALARLDTAALRQELLSINGVGHETADDILLYAFGRPLFVVDAYTRRLLGRLGFAHADSRYDDLRLHIEGRLRRESAARRGKRGPPHLRTLRGLYNEYHALIVAHGKHICRKKPLCPSCPLLRTCPSGTRGQT
jgi:endonuclease-3 related protein